MSERNPSANFLSVKENSEFLSLFSHRWDFLRAAHPQPGDPPQWKTETRYPLSDRVWREGKFLYGVRFGKTTNYFLIDLDTNSPYHPAKDAYAVSRISEALEVLGVTDYLALSSSYSGGVHLYYPLSKPVESWKLGLAVTAILERAGFPVYPGKIEVFPNRRLVGGNGKPSLFSGHRLPLQAGSYLLNRDWEPIYSSENWFCACWERVSEKNSVPVDRLNYWAKQIPDRRLSKRAEGFLADLNAEIEAGWTDRGQTNRLLGRIALREYIFGGFLESQPALTGDRLVAKIVHVAVNLPGYQEFCHHQHEIGKRAEEWARCAENSRYWPYRQGKKPQAEPEEKPPSWQKLAASASREKIRSAIATLLKENRLPIGSSDRFQVLTKEFKIGGSTLYKNRDLWHPEAVETPPAPPQRENEVGSELCGEFTTHSISNLLKQTSRNTALGTGFSDFVHDCEQKTSRNNALEADFKDSS